MNIKNTIIDAYGVLMSRIAGGPVPDQDEIDQLELNTDIENAHLLLAKDRFEMARAGRRREGVGDLSSHWKQMKRMYENDHWDGTAPAYKSRPVLPFTFALIESMVPRLTDTNPKITVLPRSDRRDQGLAEDLTAGQEHLWYVNRMDEQMGEGVRLMLKYGAGILKTYWDPDFYRSDRGEVRYEVVHPQNFFPDPRAYEMDQMEFCFAVVPKPLSWFRREFPEKGTHVRADDTYADTADVSHSQQSREDRGATLYEYWFRNQGGDICRMYFAGNVVLALKATQFYKHNKFPFTKLADYPLDKEFWPLGEIEIIASLNKLVNSYEAQIIDNTRLMTNTQWILDVTRSGIRESDTAKITNRPGAVIPVHDINAIRKEPGVPIPAQVAQHAQQLVFTMEQVLGVHDVVQGRRPPGVRAASAIIALQEAANLRIREKARNLTRALTEVGKQSIWLMLEFYDDARLVRQFEGDAMQFTTLDIREALKKRAVELGGEIGELVPGTPVGEVPEEQLEELMGKIHYPEFDVEVKVGPAVPYSQALQYEQAIQFFQVGAVDRQALLETTNFPNRAAILARMEGREAAQMEEERVGEAGMQPMQLRGRGGPQAGRGRPPGLGARA